MDVPASPTIEADSWGRLEVGGVVHKDAKLWPGGCEEWDWAETGTSHHTGIQPADIVDVVAHGAVVVVLATGRSQRLGVAPETLRHLEDRGLDVAVLPTAAAIARYNDLAAARVAVGALIHSTC